MLIVRFILILFKTEVDMMKERFAKLLLGEDMSGSGKGVCTALAISNAITNLCGMFSFLHTDIGYRLIEKLFGLSLLAKWFKIFEFSLLV